MSERGQSFVELTVSFMLIVLILAGAVDFGRAYFAVIALRDAAQEGVIYASIEPGDVTGIEARVREVSDSPIDMVLIPASAIDVSWNLYDVQCVEGQVSPSQCQTKCADFYVDAGGATQSNWVRVQVEYDFPFTMPIIQEFFPGGTLTLRVEDVHTILGPPCP